MHVALVGNPNCGKTTLFNVLTGLNQKIGNFPGVTVDKKTGEIELGGSGSKQKATLIDLPGTYSLYPKSMDEEVAFQALCDPENEHFPDVTILVADATNLKRSLFLCSQVIDLKIPVVFALNMMDLAERHNIKIDIKKLSERLGVPVIKLNARKKEGIEELKQAIAHTTAQPSRKDLIQINKIAPETIEEMKKIVNVNCDFSAFILANNLNIISLVNLNSTKKAALQKLLDHHNFEPKKLQALESIERYKVISEIMESTVVEGKEKTTNKHTAQLDSILTHRIWGYLIFLFILFIVFQSIFTFAKFPMDLIEALFIQLSSFTAQHLPKGVLNDLLVNGIIAGLSGIAVFIPQIALLFAFIAILEDTGYMSRVSFIMDKLMRKFGLNGKSVIPLISGVACAVPAIMSARNIGNWKERIITIMVTPLMSCSARLPVYTLLISLVIPSDARYYFFNLQGLVLMGLYLIGFLAAIFSAWIMKFILQSKEKSYFIMELPVYRVPRWKNVGYTMVEKVKVFLFDAGKVIIAISVILWVLSSYAPGKKFQEIEAKYTSAVITAQLTPAEINAQEASEKLESSYAGILGKKIEPFIAPLGFDWKIGISLVTSLAAREVFVGTMSTIYSVGDAENTKSIREKMLAEINPKTGEKVFTPAVGISLMLFYVFAMQCMSTIAVVYRETKHWKWPLIQFVYMGALAYISSFIAYWFLK
ncbi:MAG: ferrous iron transport protein B [Bacteroidetes bacterium]|nr:ferrous iron transport protein B [Bacteroidota bacterium]